MHAVRVFLLAGMTTLACTKSDAPNAPVVASEHCQGTELRAFDFWAGTWEVHIADGRLAGHNHVEIAHGGCALIEHWTAIDGGGGTSINYVDPETEQWVQNWVDSRGGVIQLSGGWDGESMRLQGRWAPPKGMGPTQKMRGVWTPLADGRVRQAFETSLDGSEWKPWFEGFYSRAD